MGKIRTIRSEDDVDSRTQFSSNFNWLDSSSELEAKQGVKTVPVELNDFLYDIVLKSELKQNSKSNIHQCMAGPLITKTFQHQLTSRMTFALNWFYYSSTALSQLYLSAQMKIQFLHEGTLTGNYAYWLTYEDKNPHNGRLSQ